MSHHGSSPDQMDPERRVALSQEVKKLLGEFPDGRLNPQDEGALAMAVSSEGRVVKIEFTKPVAWIGFSAQEAVDLAELLIKRARAIAARTGEVLEVRL